MSNAMSDSEKRCENCQLLHPGKIISLDGASRCILCKRLVGSVPVPQAEEWEDKLRSAITDLNLSYEEDEYFVQIVRSERRSAQLEAIDRILEKENEMEIEEGTYMGKGCVSVSDIKRIRKGIISDSE